MFLQKHSKGRDSMADAANRGRWAALGSGPLFGVHVVVSRRFLRIGPAWAVAGGALAAGAPLTSGSALLSVLGAVILADALWGGLWALMATGPVRIERQESWRLPYLQDSAPLMQMSRWLSGLASGTGCHELFAAVILAVGLALLLGGAAVLLTLLALLCAVWAQILAKRSLRPSLVYALLAVGLPWALGTSLGGPGEALAGPLALGAAFVILEWGAQCLRWPVPAATWGVWAGQASILVVLIVLRLPWVVPLATALLLPPSWWLLRSQALSAIQINDLARDAPEGSATIDRTAPAAFAVSQSALWWWMVLVLCAVAMRQLIST